MTKIRTRFAPASYTHLDVYKRQKQVLVVPGKGFNWNQPDHFRIVYLPDIRQLDKAMKKMKEFFATYKQG